eukprot:170917_1
MPARIISGLFTSLSLFFLVHNVNGYKSSGSSCAGSNYCPQYQECEKYSYYTLALQNWCRNDTWSIHGLWPNYSPSCWPQYCNRDSKWYPVDGSLKQQMTTYWNWCEGSIYKQQTGWQHEWMRHGLLHDLFFCCLSFKWFILYDSAI